MTVYVWKFILGEKFIYHFFWSLSLLTLFIVGIIFLKKKIINLWWIKCHFNFWLSAVIRGNNGTYPDSTLLHVDEPDSSIVAGIAIAIATSLVLVVGVVSLFLTLLLWDYKEMTFI